MLSFIVHGIAQPKGSARAFVPKGWTRAVVTSANPKNKGWEQLVATEASRAIERLDHFQIMTGHLGVRVVFYLPRPKSIRNRPLPHTTKPDLDKCLRSAIDAMTGVVYRDDALIVEIVARKKYAQPGQAPCADITVIDYSGPLDNRKAG